METAPTPPLPNGAAAAPEVPPPAAPPAPPGDYSKNYSAVLRKEQALHREREAFKAERAAFEAEKAKALAANPPPPRPKSPLEALEADADPQKLALATKAELKAFREEQEAEKLKAAEDAKAAAEAQAAQTIADFKVDIADFLKSKPDEYELITLNEAEHLVYDTVEEYYSTKNEVLSIKAASDLVESYLEKRHKAILEKSKKLKAAPPPPESPVDTKSPAPKRTLSNDLTAQTPTLLVKNSVQEDAFQRALKALG